MIKIIILFFVSLHFHLFSSYTVSNNLLILFPFTTTPSMQLEQLQRERINLYKEQLKQEMLHKEKEKKEANNYTKRKEERDMNELIERLNQDDVRRLHERKSTQMLLQEHNTEISAMKRNGYMQMQNHAPLPNSKSFTDNIYNDDVHRIEKIKSELKYQKKHNNIQEEERRRNQNDVKHHEKEEEERHLRRVREMEEESRKNYEEIRRRHSQNMKMFDMHSSLMMENEQYRKLGEKFTDCSEDILSSLHRDQQTKRKKDSRYTQQVLKDQMQEYKSKRDMEKSHILEGDELEKSLFRALLHHDSYNKKSYAEELKNQMSERDHRKSAELRDLKERYQVKGVYGGEHGRERQYQIEYMDKKLGLRPIRRGEVENSQEKRAGVSNQEQNYPHSDQMTKSIHMDRPQNNLQRSTPQGSEQSQRSTQQLKTNNPPPTKQYSTPKASSQHNHFFLPPQQNKNNNNNNSMNTSELPVQEKNSGVPQNIPNTMPAPPPESNESRRLFRSFDLVSGKSKFYS